MTGGFWFTVGLISAFVLLCLIAEISDWITITWKK